MSYGSARRRAGIEQGRDECGAQHRLLGSLLACEPLLVVRHGIVPKFENIEKNIRLSRRTNKVFA
jgi:hypothetical protein